MEEASPDQLIPGAKLFGADLSKRDWGAVNLDGAILTNSNLSRACFSEGYLTTGEIHTKHNLNDQLWASSFCGADLRGTDLTGAHLMGCDFENANLNGACLDGADLRRANLRNAKLEFASLVDAHLSEACLDGADLSRGSLQEAVATVRGSPISHDLSPNRGCRA